MEAALNVLALVKGDEKFIFMFDDANKTETLRTLARYAADQNSSLSWYDAAILSQRIRSMNTKQAEQPTKRFES